MMAELFVLLILGLILSEVWSQIKKRRRQKYYGD